MYSIGSGLAHVFLFCICFTMNLFLFSTLTIIHAKSSDPFQEEAKSHPLKIVVSLDYTEKQFRDGVGKISVSYEDGDGFKEIKKYDFDEMMKRAHPDPVKVKAKFPRNTMMSYEDYLICVTVLKNQHDKCANDSRSPSTDKERLHISIP